MSTRTTFLSRLIGLYLILISLSMVTHKHATVETMTALIYNPAALYVIGAFAMAAGLAMILGHNVWSGGVLPVVVTLTGWLMLTKSVLLLFLSPQAASEFFLVGLHFEQLFYFYGVFALILGVYLTYSGFRAANAK